MGRVWPLAPLGQAGISMTLNASVAVNQPVTGASFGDDFTEEDAPALTLLQRFEALWSNRRYMRRVRRRQTPTLREGCMHFYEEANTLLESVGDHELPDGVLRNPDGKVNGGDIVRHVDAFRAMLVTK